MRTCLGSLLVFLLALLQTGCAASGRANVARSVPALRIDTPMAAPAWALKERELLDLAAQAAAKFERVCVAPNGYLKIKYEHGGGTSAPDDAFEDINKLPILYALGADEITWRVWWKVWQGSLEQCSQQGLFENEMCKYMDWHHNAEHYQGLWLAGLCAPDDPEYRRQILKFTSFYDGTNPRVPNYDPERKIIRSMLSGGAGPVFHATREQWCEGGGEFWDAWLDCGHDGPVNLVTTCFGTTAFALTGDEAYRRRTLEYIDAWRKRAEDNGGIIPSIVKLDGTVPKEWWGGVMGWDFKPFGGLFQVSSGPRAAWANALLLTGDASYYDTMRHLCDELWKSRLTDDAGRVADIPRYIGKDGWYGKLSPGCAQGVYTNLLANIYMATMKHDDLQRILDRPFEGRCGHSYFHEGGFERSWILFLQGRNPQWLEASLDECIRHAKGQIASIDKLQETGDLKDMTGGEWWRWRVGWCAPLVNAMTGGPIPLWHGQLTMARFRYFDPERERPGIPRDCAALVEKLADDSATLVLVNTSATEPRTVLVQTGAYAEHQCVSVQPEGGEAVGVDGAHFTVRLAPGAGARLTVKMKRYANTPTLRMPWRAKDK